MKKKITIYLFLLTLIIIPSIRCYSTPLPTKYYGDLGGGSAIIESSIDGFYLKTMPVITSGFTILVKYSQRINLGLDLSLSYNFKSNYNDYFYYGPFTEIGFSPIFEIYLFKFLTLGIFGTIAPTYTSYENSLDLKIGSYFLIPIRTRWLKSIILQYEHGFLDGYKFNEKILLKTRILIYKKG